MEHKTQLVTGDEIIVNDSPATVDSTAPSGLSSHTKVIYTTSDGRPGQFTLSDVKIASALGFSTGMDRPPEFEIGDD